MKKCLIIMLFFLLAFSATPVSAGSDVFLTNKDGTKTSQFALNDEIYIEGICLPANQGTAKIFITYDKTWQENDKLSDMSGGIETFAASMDSVVPRIKIWKAFREGTFDVLIDTNNDYILQAYEQQCVIGLTGAGFLIGNPAPAPAPAPVPPPTPAPVPAAPPVSEPEPDPAPATVKPSTAFSINENIEANDFSNIRKTAGGKIIGTQNEGAKGVVAEGPTRASLGGKKFWFWNINFEKDPDGWISESNLKSAPKPAENIAVENVTDQTSSSTDVAQTANIIEASNGEAMAWGMLAQLMDSVNPFTDSIIIGVSILFGLVFGAAIIARAINPSRPVARLISNRRKVKRIKILPPEILPPGQIQK